MSAVVYLRHLFDLLTGSASVSTEALACATGVITDTTARAVLARHSTVAAVHFAAIGIQNVLVIVVTLGEIRLFVVRFGFSVFSGVSLLPTSAAERCVVLQLVVRNGSADSGVALVIKRIVGRGALHQGATWAAVSLVAQATVVHVGIPSTIVGSKVSLLEQLSEVLQFVRLNLCSLSNGPVVSKVPVGAASSVSRAVIGTSSALAR